MDRAADARIQGRLGSIEYRGVAHAPLPGTYYGVNAALGYTTLADSGRFPTGRAWRSLRPLLAAALYDAGFALEAGPVSTWRN